MIRANRDIALVKAALEAARDAVENTEIGISSPLVWRTVDDAINALDPAAIAASVLGEPDVRDAEIAALRVLNEETVLAGYPGGDRTQTLSNVRAMRAEINRLRVSERTWAEEAMRSHDIIEQQRQRVAELEEQLRVRKEAE